MGTLVQGAPRNADENHEQAHDRPNDAKSSAQPQHLGLYIELTHVEHIYCDDIAVIAPEPSGSGRSWNSEVGGDAQVASLPNELTEPVVIGLIASKDRHGQAIMSRASPRSTARRL